MAGWLLHSVRPVPFSVPALIAVTMSSIVQPAMPVLSGVMFADVLGGVP